MPKFNVNAATDNVALLVQLAGGRLHRVALLKVLYLAEREALALYGSTITGATFVSMQYGPVACEVYQLIKGERACARWAEYLASKGDDVVLLQDPSNDYTCRGHEQLVKKHWEAHRDGIVPGEHPTALVAYSHTLPEWRDPAGQGEVLITQRQMLEAQGVSEDMIEDMERLDDEMMVFLQLGEPAF